MAGTDRFYIGGKKNWTKISSIRLRGLLESPLRSASLRIATVGTQNAVDVPPGAIVYKVALQNVGSNFTSASLSVGVSGTIDKFLDDVSTLVANDIAVSGLGGTANADPVAGAYFSSGGTIQLGVKATDEGSVRVLVWYTGTS